MRSLAALTPLLALVPSFVVAQYGGGGGSSSSSASSKTSTTKAPSSTVSAAAASTSSSDADADVFDVTLGENGAFTFSPSNLSVDAGDIIQFHVTGGQPHSIVLGTFDAPCQPNPSNTIYSGAINGPSSGDAANMFVVTVNSSDPMVFYCGNPGHCQLGMALVLNEPT